MVNHSRVAGGGSPPATSPANEASRHGIVTITGLQASFDTEPRRFSSFLHSAFGPMFHSSPVGKQ